MIKRRILPFNAAYVPIGRLFNIEKYRSSSFVLFGEDSHPPVVALSIDKALSTDWEIWTVIHLEKVLITASIWCHIPLQVIFRGKYGAINDYRNIIGSVYFHRHHHKCHVGRYHYWSISGRRICRKHCLLESITVCESVRCLIRISWNSPKI